LNVDLRAVVRCAIYTRKSSEEGLEQSFNSLDAQREACEAFIASQRQEGWQLVPTHYDDRGYSGGSMERPALKRLLKDIEDRKINTIVVYKVDRLTRSLADFAKIVEALDARGVSFVSVTQQFNTTSSMGRLTLNVLLSFAQFEREVTGERIRDKIAASKKKGMWMGGIASLGYSVRDRKLVLDPVEAQLVNRLFKLYLSLGCVRKLKAQLDEEGILTRRRTSARGNRSGGVSYSRGALYKILQNRIYLGEIHHHEKYYEGQHEAIISRELWDQVQALLSSNKRGRTNGVRAESPSLLAGRMRDAEGHRFTSSHALKSGRRYRYYVCQGVGDGAGQAVRLPAHDAEKQVMVRLGVFLRSEKMVMDELGSPQDSPALTERLIRIAALHSEVLLNSGPQGKNSITAAVEQVVVSSDSLEVEVNRSKLRAALIGNLKPDGEEIQWASSPILRLKIQAQLRRHGGEMRLVVPADAPGQIPPPPVSSLLKAIARGRQWHDWIMSGEISSQREIARRMGLNERYVGRIMECAFLAPDIVEAILDGSQPASLTFQKLTQPLPSSWADQRRQLGFAPL